MNVYDKQNSAVTLGSSLGKGGEAEVFSLQAKPNVVFKYYHQPILAKRGTQLEQKIDLMHRIESLRSNSNLAWPLILAYDEKKQWIGYAMYRAAGVTMAKLAHAMAYEDHFPGINRKRILTYLLNFLSEVNQLHQQNIMVGDYNLNNVLLDPTSDKVTFVDCDSYQIEINGQFFPCEVGSADLTPKEHQNKAFKDIKRTLESEYFSIAIILFKCLMLGRHPYDIVGGEDPVKNLCKGVFPYVSKNKNDIPKGCWHVMWTHLPDYLQQLFAKAFTVGATNPKQRPTLAEWRAALNQYLRELNRGLHTNAVRPSLPNI
ncbi:kinase [Glaesserella parasuis]|nr:kinase [Glaesserella parasuis]